MERDPLDVAWAAGLFEGEGCFTVATKETRGKLRCQVRMGSTDRDVVERFAKIIGFGNVNRKASPSDPPHWKPLWEWSTQRAACVLEFIDLVRPYLGERRLARAEELYAAALQIGPHSSEAQQCPNGHAYTPENVLIEKRRKGKIVRRCRICRRADARRWEARRRAA